MLRLRRDGLAEAVQAIEQFVRELAPGAAAASARGAGLVAAPTRAALS
jgi:hypothetical protein